MTDTKINGARFDVAAFSEQGPRPENQDAFNIASFAELSVVVLADGMGGERSGRTAADTAIDAVLRNAPIRSLDAARRAVREANAAIEKAATADPNQFGGMGCALAILSLAENGDGLGWIAANVGDVRIISRSPDGLLRIETRDHTPAFQRWEAGEISLDQIPDSAGANRLQRAVGRGGEADVAWLPAAPGWSWLLISDGVYKAMRVEEVGAAMAAPSAAEGCEVIRSKVAARGPDDNYTAVLVKVMGGPSGHLTLAETTETTMAPPQQGRPSESRSGVATLVLALAALVLAVVALARSGGADSSADRLETDRLRIEVDSMRIQINRILDPYGPSAPAPGSGAPPQAGTP